MSGPLKINAWELPELHIENIEQLRSGSRKQDLVEQRVEVAKDLRNRGMTVERIGEILNRDHSTITHYLKYYQE